MRVHAWKFAVNTNLRFRDWTFFCLLFANNKIKWLFTNRVGDANDGEKEVGALHWDALQHGHVGQVDKGDVEAEHAEHVADGDQQK